jgi:hypothetical protein
MRVQAKMQLGAGHLRRADAMLECADKRCPAEASASADVRSKTADALGRNRKPDLGAALAALPEIAVDMLGRLGAGSPRARTIKVTAGTLGVASGRLVVDGEHEAVLIDPKTWTPRVAVAAKSYKLSPDGQTLATTDDKEVRLHDPLTAASTAFPVGELTFSDDSQRMAIATSQSVTIVALAGRKIERTIAVTALPAVQFAGKALVLRTEAGDLDVIDLGTGKSALSRPQVLDYAITEDDKRLAWVASAAGAMEVAYVDLTTFATVQAMKTTLSASAPRVAITNDGRAIAVSNGQQLVVMDTKSAKVRSLPARTAGDFGVESLYFDRDGRRVCGVFAREGELCAWDITTNALIKTSHWVSRRRMIDVKIKGASPNVALGSTRVTNGALAADEKTFALVARDGKRLFVELYDLGKSASLARLPIFEGEVSAVAVLYAADVFVVRLDNRDVVIDPKRRAVLATLEDVHGAPVAIGDVLAFAGAKGIVTVHRTTGEKQTHLADAAEVCAVGPHLVDKSGCESVFPCH